MRPLLGALLLAVSLSVASCNEATDGFDAPFGSSVSINLAPSGTTTFSPPVFLSIVQVTVTDGGDALANIQVQLYCDPTEACTFYEKADGESLLVRDLARLQEVGNPIILKTGSGGLAQRVVSFTAPSNIGETSYEGKVTAVISVGSANATVSLSE